MKFKADLLINDCKIAIEKHSDELQAEDFRLNWLSIISILRAIGHVLNKVDTKISEDTKRIIELEYQNLRTTKPEPAIYWEFIDAERNRFLKEYEHGIVRHQKFKGPKIDGQQIFMQVDTANMQSSRFSGGKFESYISSGTFKGRHEKDVAIEALEWWIKHIEIIKSKL